jgi:hypothetical protein
MLVLGVTPAVAGAGSALAVGAAVEAATEAAAAAAALSLPLSAGSLAAGAVSRTWKATAADLDEEEQVVVVAEGG